MELDGAAPFGFPRDDIPLVSYSVTLQVGEETSLILTAVHSNDAFEVSRYGDCRRSYRRYRPCTTTAELEDLRARATSGSDSSLVRRDLRRFTRRCDASPVLGRTLDQFGRELLGVLQEPGAYNWERIREGILQIYLQASIRRAEPEEMVRVHEFARDLLGFLSCVFYVKWLIGLGACEGDPDFDRLNYPRIDPDWKRMEDWETDIKWSVRDNLRCEDEFRKDPDLRRALQEFKTRTGFELKLVKRTFLGTESCQFEIPEQHLSFGDFCTKQGLDFTPQDSALQSAYNETVGPVEARILDRLMKERRLSEASPITLFPPPPPGSVHSLEQAMAWQPISGLIRFEEASRQDPGVEHLPHYDECLRMLKDELEVLKAGDSLQLRERASRHMETIWVDQYGALGLRQDLQSELIERLGVLEDCARQMTTQPRRLQSAYYKLFFELERDLRNSVQMVLERELGATWWESGVPQSVREKCQGEVNKAKLQGEDPFPPFEYCCFVDLKAILEKRWVANFQKFFEDEPGDTRGEKLAWLGRLIPVRNVLMHPRQPLSIRESWAIEVGSMRVAALAKKLGVFSESRPSTQ
jgi:hypothetical protein